MKESFVVLVLPLVTSLQVLGCSTSNSSPGLGCASGEQLACYCDQGGSGIRVCDTTGTYGACDCSATQGDSGASNPNLLTDADSGIDVSDAGTGADTPVTDASTITPQRLPLYSSCQVDTECDSNFCFLYNDGAHLCTKTCVTFADCPAPSTGCNGKGVCKDPK